MEQGTWKPDELNPQILHSHPASCCDPRQVLLSPGFIHPAHVTLLLRPALRLFPKMNQTVTAGYLVIKVSSFSLGDYIKLHSTLLSEVWCWLLRRMPITSRHRACPVAVCNKEPQISVQWTHRSFLCLLHQSRD